MTSVEKTLEQRIQVLEDIESIRSLCAAYCHYADKHQFKALSELFAEDAVFEGLEVVVGRTAILEFLEGLPEVLDDHLHFVHTHEIHVDGDIATGRCRFDAPTIMNSQAFQCAGTYYDDYQRTPQGWKFLKRKIEFAYFAPYEKAWGGSTEMPGNTLA